MTGPVTNTFPDWSTPALQTFSIPELRHLVFSFLPPEKLATTSEVCHYFKDTSRQVLFDQARAGDGHAIQAIQRLILVRQDADLCRRFFATVGKEEQNYFWRLLDHSQICSLIPLLPDDLRTLHLNGCRNMTGLAFKRLLQSCTQLEVLDVRETHLAVQGHLGESIDSLQRLRELYLGGNPFRVILTPGRSFLPTFPALEVLHCDGGLAGLDEHRLSRILQELPGQCPNLIALNLEGTDRLNGAHLQILAESYPNLRKLNIGNCTRLGDSAAQSIQQWTQLESLDLTATNVGAQTLTGVAGLSSLKSLALFDCPALTTDLLNDIVSGCPLLESVDFWNCSNVGDRAFQILANSKLPLRKLSLNRLRDLPANQYEVLASKHPGIKKLCLGDASLLDDETAAQFVAKFDDLEEANFLQASLLGDRTANALASKHVNLREVGLESASNLTDEGVLALGKGLPALTQLNLDGASVVSFETIRSLANTLYRLRKLYARTTEDVGNDAVSDICSRLPLLRELSLRGSQASILPVFERILAKLPALRVLVTSEYHYRNRE